MRREAERKSSFPRLLWTSVLLPRSAWIQRVEAELHPCEMLATQACYRGVGGRRKGQVLWTLRLSLFFFFKLEDNYNIVMFSAIHQHESVTGIHRSPTS